jgi:uncharacterized RDD family membrane protein YckC
MTEASEIKTKPHLTNRIIAGIIDYGIICSFSFTLIFTLGTPDNDGTYHLDGFPALIPIVFWGIMTIGLEQWFGATLGNSIAGLKPISINGFRNNLTFGQSFKRHLLDPVDMFFFGLVGYINIKNTEKNQRLGDLWAKTIVVDKNQTN